MLARLLGIRPVDRRDAAVGFTMLFALMAGHAILETARDALFLARLPASMLPWAYMAMAVLALFAARLGRKSLRRLSRRRALSLMLLLGVGVTMSFFLLSSLAGSASSLLMFYVWTGLFATVVVVQFWLLLGDVLDLAQAKRVFAWIAAGGLIGATFGSGLAGLVLTRFPAQVLLVAASSLFGMAALLPVLFTRTHRTERSELPATPASDDSSMVQLLRSDAYLRRLLGFVLLGTVVVTLVDFVFKAVVSTAIPEAQLGSFFARYYAILNACALLVQILIAPRVLRASGVNRTLLITPLLVLLAAFGFWFWTGLLSVLLLKGVDGSLRHSVNRTATEILYLPLQARVRERFKTLAEAVGQRGGQAIASLVILIALALNVTPHQMAWGIVVLGIAWLICILGLKPHYLELFRTQLRHGTIETRVDVADLDLHTLEALVSALSSEDDAEVIAALEMFTTYNKLNLIPALILFHPSRAVVLRAFHLFAESARRDVVRLSARLLRHADPEIRAAALRHFSTHDKSEEPLRRCLLDDSPGCRATALVGLVSAGLMPDEEAQRPFAAIVEGDSAEARQALALSLHQLPASRYAWLALALAKHKQPGLAQTVGRSLSLSPTIEHFPALICLLARREGREDAREALRRLGEPALAHLERALFDLSLPRSVRRHLPRTISYFATPRAARVLLAWLPHEPDYAVQYKILRGLGRMRADRPDIPVDEEQLLDYAQGVLRHAIDILSWRVVIDGGRSIRSDYDTSAAELLSALLADYEASELERLFRLLHILEPTEEFQMIYDGLRSAVPSVHAGSRELLEHVVPGRLRDGIVAVVDDGSAAERLRAASDFHEPRARVRFTAIEQVTQGDEAPSEPLAIEAQYAACLADMLDDPSPVLRSLASYHVSELGIAALSSKLVPLPTSQRGSLSELTERSVELPPDSAGLELGRA